jgi:hypothetical protein
MSARHRIARPSVAPQAAQAAVATHLRQLDAEFLRSLLMGYRRAATSDALRTAALIREELESRGEVLP